MGELDKVQDLIENNVTPDEETLLSKNKASIRKRKKILMPIRTKRWKAALLSIVAQMVLFAGMQHINWLKESDKVHSWAHRFALFLDEDELAEHKAGETETNKRGTPIDIDWLEFQYWQSPTLDWQTL